MNGTPQTYTYFTNGDNKENGQRLASDGVDAYTYDANGNTATRGGTTFGWDADDRLTSITGSVTATYTYDYQGRRTSKTVNGATTTYLYDGLNLVRASGATTRDVLFGPGIDEPLAMVQGTSWYYFVVDGLGSVAEVTGRGGKVQNTYLYDAWGVVRAQTGAVPNDFGYTARELAEAGLWYYRARYYQPGIGRFGSEDPKRWADPLRNQYRYCAGSPTACSDPRGTDYIPAPVCNLDPIYYFGWGETRPGRQGELLPIPPPLPGPPPLPDLPGCTPPWWDVDFVCTKDGWKKTKGPALLLGGVIYGYVVPLPPDWIPPFPCPPRHCP